ncbi:unnamed protein product [Parnassius mnemosyne]|uniref:DUF7041 domain-containing protein n=1 Tax=Parnassius mnemosyne TaxID=213953 RepID=A0AAV1LBX6_9NEOP
MKAAGKDNKKKIWNVVKNINNLNKPKELPAELLKIENNPLSSVNFINTFFANIGSNLSNKLKIDLPPLPTTVNPVTVKSKSFVLLKTSVEELERLILNLKTDCGASWDGITPKILKCLKELIIPPLNHSFNRCLEEELERLATVLHSTQQENALLRAQIEGKPLKTEDTPINELSPQVCKVAPKVPPFWHQKPALWFAHIETQFRVAGITGDQTMYDHVIGQLDFRITAEIEDIVTNPPRTNKYEHLKTEIIRRLSQSEEERVRQLLNDEELGDRKPSQFLRHLRSLAGSTLTDESILRQLFMRRLPQHLQAILAASADPLDDIAIRADKILEVAPSLASSSSPFVHATSASSSGPTFDLCALDAQVQQLSATVAALTRTRENHRSRSRSKSRNRTRSDGKLCWYHWTFKEKASKCVSPCSWQAENCQASQ